MEETKVNGEAGSQSGKDSHSEGSAKSVISINRKNVTIVSTGKDGSKATQVTTTPLRSNQDPALTGGSHVTSRIKDTQFVSALSQKFQTNGALSVNSALTRPAPASSTPSSRGSLSRSSSSSSTNEDVSAKLSSMLLQQQQQLQQQSLPETTVTEEVQEDGSGPVENGHGGEEDSDASSADAAPTPAPSHSALMRSISEQPQLRKMNASYTPRPKSQSTESDLSVNGGGGTGGTGIHQNKHDLMAALTAVVTSGSPGLRKTRGPGKAGGVTEVFTSKKTSGSSAPSAANGETSSEAAVEGFEPKDFLSQVAEKDSSGTVMPEWKRLIMAKPLAQKALAEYLEKKKKDDYEARFKGMPDWKRALIEKKEAGN